MARLKVVGIGSTLLLLVASVTWLALPSRQAAAPAIKPYILLPPGAPEMSGVAHEPAGVTPLQLDSGRATPSAPGRTGGSLASGADDSASVASSAVASTPVASTPVASAAAPSTPAGSTPGALRSLVEYVETSVKSAAALVSSPSKTGSSVEPAPGGTRWTVVDVPAAEVQRLSQPGTRNKGPIASRDRADSASAPLANREGSGAPVVDTDADWYAAPADEPAVAAANSTGRSTHGRAARKPLPVRDAGNADWYDSLSTGAREEEEASSSLSSFEDSLLAGIDPAAVFSGETRSASGSRAGVPTQGVRRSRGGAGMAPAIRGLTNAKNQNVTACSTPATRWRLVKLEPPPSESVATREARPSPAHASLPAPESELAAPQVVLASLGPKLPGTGATEFPGLAEPLPEQTPKPTAFCPIGLIEKKTKGERYCARADKSGITFREGPVAFLYANGKKKAQGNYVNGKLEGAYAEFASNGKKTAEGTIQKGKKNGEWSFWWDDGKKQSQGTFVNGERTGKWIYWDEKGRRLSEGEIRTIGNVEKKQGKWVFFHPNGNKKQEGTFVAGKKDGAWKTFDESGKQVSVLVYRDGEEEIR